MKPILLKLNRCKVEMVVEANRAQLLVNGVRMEMLEETARAILQVSRVVRVPEAEPR